ncbi:MAG: UDP-N-acetylmuramoyl-L-alanyl-D-glutamate--2,6-diaminopimelate ligase, partial [Rhizobiaceae bacterium]|nr:UDP-N-acetylmuramoyl-L-alanyl-D-glutamate--2,6-diaminopimelate ligase [Rhizobiaceae bacterium]
MNLRDIAGHSFPEVNGQVGGALGDLEITGLSADSRRIVPGMAFVAVAGTKADGASFIADAISRGASVIVAGEGAKADSAPLLTVSEPRRFLAIAASNFYGRQPGTMVAVTGTAGKTSVASFTRQIWAHAGHPAAMIGTTGVASPTRNDYGSLTTPDPVSLHQLLAELADEGVTHAAMEASSHGLDQFRLDGVKLAAAAFTNLGRDHMDYHPTVEDYMAAKMRLFRDLLPKGSPAVVFADDAWSAQAIAAARDAGQEIRTVGRKGDFLTLKRVEHFRHKQVAEVHVGDEIFEVHIPLAGDFQIANALVAAGLAISTGVSASVAMAALEKLI